jgi:ethanolamine-phosphate cytidylyltransferase
MDAFDWSSNWVYFGTTAIIGTLGAVALVLRHLHSLRNDEKRLLRKLAAAERRVQALRVRLGEAAPEPAISGTTQSKPVRIWMDGAFDMMHYGHVNAFRKGRAVGTHLVVGVNDTKSITECKGAPVMDDEERLCMVRACKFVDEVVPNVPYVMSDEYVRWVIDKYNIDYIVHGDDACIVDGRDVYESAKALGKYRTISRTEGVSTTEIVGRTLTLTKAHHQENCASPPSGSPLMAPSQPPIMLTDALPRMNLAVPLEPAAAATPSATALDDDDDDDDDASGARKETFVRESKFMTTSNMIRLFSSGCATPPAGAKVVYVDGGWDMFHAGHVALLEGARALGDFLLVGVHNDAVVNQHRGSNYPILNTNERTLSVLSCRHVGDVVIDPPWHITRDMISALNISVVAHGSTSDRNLGEKSDPYAVPKAMGIYKEIPSTSSLTVEKIVERIDAHRARMQAKIDKKMKAEREYYNSRYGYTEGAAAS